MKERFKNFTVMITRIKTEEMIEFNLKSPHVSCLYYLYKENSLTAKELCDICDEDKASISRSLEYLETKGFVVSETSVKKKYRTNLTLTEAGLSVAQKIAEKIDRILDVASEGLSEEDRVILYKSLNLIATNLQSICDSYDK